MEVLFETKEGGPAAKAISATMLLEDVDPLTEELNSIYRQLKDVLQRTAKPALDEIGSTLDADSRSMLVPSGGFMAKEQMKNDSFSLSQKPLEY